MLTRTRSPSLIKGGTWTTSLVSSVVDPDTQERIAVIRDRLMRQFGYDELSADAVLQEVAHLFARTEGSDGGDREEAA